MKIKKKWFVAAVLCILLGAAAGFVRYYFISGTVIVSTSEMQTSGRNRSLVYDDENDILYAGTHEGILAAFKDGEVLWKLTESKSGYSKIVLNAKKDKLYTANEDQHIYVYDANDGSLVLDINAQRLIVGIAVNADETKIAVVTNTGKNKSNLIIYSIDGQEIANTSYKSVTLRAVEYCADSATLLVANKRGEIKHMTENGEELGVFEANYDVKHMKIAQDLYWVLGRDGTYHVLDENLNCVRKGAVDNDINATIATIGTDLEGRYVLVGTKQGYIFVLNDQDQQVYVGNFDYEITDTASGTDGIYFTSIAGDIHVFSITGVLHSESFGLISTVLYYLIYVFNAAFILCIIFAIPGLRKRVWNFGKKVWKNRMAYLFLLPIFVILYFFIYRGMFIGLTRAFTNWSKNTYTLAEIDFVGLDNFMAMFEEGYFLIGIKNMIIMLIFNLLKVLTVPVLVAWLIYSIKGDRRKYVHRFLFVLPIVIPGVVGVMLWRMIYDPTVGLLNQLLGRMGLETLQHVWLGDAKTALASIIFMGFPYIGALPLLIYYGALINISDEMVESARIDGAGRWHIFWKIQLPLIRPQMSLMVTLTFISSIQDYSTIYIMTAGGPGTATYVPALELYFNVAQYGRYGYASAMGVVLMIFTLGVTIISNVLKKRKEA